MKFKIRFADQIVGFFSLTAIIGLIVLIFAIGSGQKWFTKKLNFYTMFDSGSGVSVGMNLTYKGFSIGKIKAISLEGSQVRVDYYILADYQDYALEDSLVQLITSPIGLGSEFKFHPGNGPDRLSDGAELYRLDSIEGLTILAQGQNQADSTSDSIGALMNKASNLLDNINTLLSQISGGISGNTSRNNQLAKLILNAVEISNHAKQLSASLTDADGAIPKLLGPQMTNSLQGTLNNLTNITDNITTATADADVLLNSVNTLVGSADELVGGANNLISGADTEITDLLKEIDNVLIELEDVLTGVKNNPLIKGGIPDRSQSSTSTFHLRNEEF